MLSVLVYNNPFRAMTVRPLWHVTQAVDHELDQTNQSSSLGFFKFKSGKKNLVVVLYRYL
jgi:hypothetical protein